MNLKLVKIIIILVAIMQMSCQKQEAPSIETGEIRTQREIERLEACSLVNFNRGVVLHSNTLLLFKCTKWDEEFPHLYSAIKRVQGSSWDHFMGPIDKAFIENLGRRDRVFKNIRELDSKNGLDDLSRVIVALNETNFFDSTRAMFVCIGNPTDETCKDRQGVIPEKKSIKNILKIVDSSPESIERSSRLIKTVIKAIGADQEKLRLEINKFREDPIFVSVRLKLVDALANKIRSGLSSDDRNFLSKLLLVGDKEGNQPWIYSWIHDQKMTREKFGDLLEYPILVNPSMIGEFKALRDAYNEGFSCSIKDTMDPNELIDFDFKNHLADHAFIIKSRNQKSYFDYASSAVTGLKMSAEICAELQTNKYKTDFLKMLVSFAEFMGEKKFFDLTKFLVTHTTIKKDSDKPMSENIYLADLVASEIFSSSNIINEQIIKHTRNFYPTIFDIIKNIGPESYVELGLFIDEALKEENDIKFKGVADFWNFFNSTEKNFVFNFVDRHFEGDTQYLLLFDFYTKFLEDFRETQPIFRDSWIGSESKEEMSYLAIEDAFSKFAGRETLQDFKKFFSRDQILKVLEIISNGNNVNAIAREELAYLRSAEYVTRSQSERYEFKVIYNPAQDIDYNSKAVLECMKTFNELDNGLYKMIKNLPAACAKVNNENIAFRLFGWLNSIEESYLEFKQGTNQNDSLLNDKGLLSPYMLNSTLATSKVFDSLLGPYGSALPTKNGINYLLSSLKFHLDEQRAATLLDKNLNFATKWFSIKPENNLIHRNALIKEFTKEKNFSYANELFKNTARLMMDYGDWVKSGKLEKNEKENNYVYDPAFDCTKVINQNIAPNPCPSRAIVKEHTKGILKYLSTVWEPETGTAVAQLLKALKPGEGLDIPLEGKKTKKYRMTLKETMKYLYDTSDKNLKVNRKNLFYVNPQGKEFNDSVTTLERVETVIREVRFDNNYLGTAFLNAVVKADDYNKEVENRKSLLKKCIKIPVIRCARPMSDDDLRMGKNALESFDSLLDINNGRGEESLLKYGDYLKTFEQTLVASSAKDAQEVQLFPLKNELLLKHNGRLLGEMTMMTMWSNTARVIRDRIGRTRDEFEKFMQREDFNRVDRALLYGFDLGLAAPSAERLVKKLQIVAPGEKQSVVDHSIDWIASLNYQETRMLEEVVGRILVVGSYLGTPDVVFGSASTEADFERYKNNNLLQLFLAAEKVIDYWPTLRKYFPNDMKLVNAISPINNALIFITDRLATTNDPKKNIAYRVLNDLFLILDTALFDELSDPRIASFNSKTANGLDLLLGFIQKPENVTQGYEIVRDDYQYVDLLHNNKAEWFKSFGQNIERIANSKEIDLTPLRDYLNFTSKSEVCFTKTVSCAPNYHFDEVTSLVHFLNKKSSTGDSNFILMTKKVLVENFDQLNSMINDLLPALRIKEVRPPLNFN